MPKSTVKDLLSITYWFKNQLYATILQFNIVQLKLINFIPRQLPFDINHECRRK